MNNQGKPRYRILLLLLLFMVNLTACASNNDEYDADSSLLEEEDYLEQEADKIASEFTKGEYTLYYTNEKRTSLEEATVYFDFTSTSLSKEIESILNELANMREMGVKESSSQSIIPKSIQMEYSIMEEESGSVVQIYMNDAFDELKPNESVVLRTGIHKSVMNLGKVSRIEYYVERDGEYALVDTARADDQVLLNQYDNSFYTDEVTVTLYFADDEKSGLIQEQRTITLNFTDKLQEAVIRELISGPQEDGHVKLIPDGTQVQSVWIKDAVCYVDLNADFQNHFLGSSKEEELVIYSIVNSLSELPGIEYIQLLIDGERRDLYYLNVSINTVLTKNEDLILTESEEEE